MFWKRINEIFAKRKEIERLKGKVLNEEMDLDALFMKIKSVNEANALFKELCIKTHPDRYVGNHQKHQRAECLFKEVQSNKLNYRALLEIEKKVDGELIND